MANDENGNGNGLFGAYSHIPAIAANAWTGHPSGVTLSMFEGKSTDFAGAMNDYVSAAYDDFGEEEWMWEEDEDAVDKAIFQLKKGPAAPGSFMTPYGPALANESIMEIVQEYPGAAELTGDVQEMFAAAEDFIEDGGEDFDDFVYELEDFAEESGNDLWSVIQGAGSAIADTVGNVISGIGDWMEPYTTYGADGEPEVTPEPEPKDEGDSIWDKFMDVLTVTGTAEMQGGPALVGAGVDWLGDQAENYFETVADVVMLQDAANAAVADYVLNEGEGSSIESNFARIEEDKYYKDSIKELDVQLEEEGLQPMLAFIEAELGGAVDQEVVEDWVDILRQRGTEGSLGAADDIAALLDRIEMPAGMGEPPDVTEAAVGPGTETTPTTTAEDVSASYWSPMTGEITGPITTTESLEQDIDTGGVGITTAEQGLDILPEDGEGFDDVPLGGEDDEGDDLPVDPLDPEAPSVDYKTQFDRYFSGLRGSASYEAQQRKDALFKDAEMLFYLDTDWNDRDLDFPTTPIAGVPWEMHGDEDVKKEEAFFSNWLNETYATQTRAERYGPDFYQSVQDLRNDMYELRDKTEDEFNEMIGTGEISPDRATDRAAFMRGDAYSNDRLGSLVAAYNIHPGADVWMQQELRSMYKNALDHWITSGRKPEDFMHTFVKDQPEFEMTGGPQRFRGI